jgi:hypothetical protein
VQKRGEGSEGERGGERERRRREGEGRERGRKGEREREKRGGRGEGRKRGRKRDVMSDILERYECVSNEMRQSS